MSKKLDWIFEDKDNAWFDTLDRVALNLICQYTIMAIDLTKQDIYLLLFYNILCIV